MFQRILLRIRNSIWLIPSFYSVLSLVLAIIVITLDTLYYTSIEKILPNVLLTNVDLAQTILGAIAGSLLTMTTITFSTIMVVLTTYSSQFSPRTLQNFVTNQTTMRVLGVFMGGFVFSIFSLLFMKGSIDHLVIASGVGVIFALVCLAFFAYFIHHVSKFIQVTNLIDHLTKDVLKIVQAKLALVENNDKISFVHRSYENPGYYKGCSEVFSSKYGFLQLLDYNELLRLAVENDQVIRINEKIGQFITQNQSIFTVYHINEKLNIDYQPLITVGSERSTMQDEEFALKKLVEITLRAISPAINDPNTAIDCIQHIGFALGEVSRLDGEYIIYQDDQKKARVIVPQKPFEEILYSTFYQISHYGKDDISVLLAIIEALQKIVENSSDKHKKIVLDFSQYILEGIDVKQLKQLDQKKIDGRLSKLQKICHKTVPELH